MAPISQLISFPYSFASEAEILEILSAAPGIALPPPGALSSPANGWSNSTGPAFIDKRAEKSLDASENTTTIVMGIMIVILLVLVLTMGLTRAVRQQPRKRRDMTFACHWLRPIELETGRAAAESQIIETRTAKIAVPQSIATAEVQGCLLRSIGVQTQLSMTIEEEEACTAGLGLWRSERPSSFSKSMYRPDGL